MSDLPPFEDDLEFLISRNAEKPVHPPPYDIVQWAESRRVLPGSSPHPGAYRIALTEYLREPLECLSPFSPVTDVALMKAAQTGASTMSENAICYYIESGAEILYVSGSLELLREWSTRRLDAAITSCGLRHLIGPQTENAKTRQTGDRIMSKSFRGGGSLMLASAQAAASLRSSSRRVAIFDECDSAPPNLVRTREGNYLDVAIARTAAYGHRAKRLFISTPGEVDSSLILKKHDQGDARKYMVKCVFPECGKEQELRFGDENTPFGLKPEYNENGILITVRYKCEGCGRLWENYHKAQLLASGRWVPTRLASNPNYRSYHISSLYSMLVTWQETYQLYLNQRMDQESLKSWYNLSLGLPFTPVGSRPELKTVLEARGTWHAGTIPSTEILFTVAAADVMHDRVELLITGHGEGSKMWYLQHVVFEGDTSNADSGAWLKLFDWTQKGGLTLRRAQDGRQFTCELVLIDCADTATADAVYSFCENRMLSTFACRGMGLLPEDKKKRGDVPRGGVTKRYRFSNTGIAAHKVILLATWALKTTLYSRLRIPREPQDPQRPGFQDMPLETTDEEYLQILSEERHADGHWSQVREANHLLDMSVYNLAAGSIYLDSLIDDHRSSWTRRGAKPQDVMNIDTHYVLQQLKRQTAPRVILR